MMNLANQNFKKYLGLVGIVCGTLLMGVPAIAQMRPQRNVRIIPPTPEQQQPASTRINPINGRVHVRLVNETGTNIVYEVIGDTNPRAIPGKSSITLQNLNLNTPVTITFYRPDYGLLRVRPQVTSQPGVLEVRFAATTDLGLDKNALTIQPTGGVYLN